MISIPLEPRAFLLEERFQLDIQLDSRKAYEICVSSLYFDTRQGDFHGGAVGELHLDCVDVSNINKDQIVARLCKNNNTIQSREWYKIDKRDLKFISLRLTGITVKSLAVTLQLREINGQISTLPC